MIDHVAHDDAGLEPAQALHMPQQVQPVDRNEVTTTPAAALSDNPAVQANLFWELPISATDWEPF
ncbi:hypothetical protein ACWHLZ_29080 [Streptomyces chartreusis]